MTLTSFAFIGFVLAVLLLWDLLRGRLRKLWLLLASYAFYILASGSWRFCLLLVCSTLVSWALARGMARRPARKKLLLRLGCLFQLGLLLITKYLGAALSAVFPQLLQHSVFTLLLEDPIGISFFSFSILSYLFDVYHGKLEAERSLLDYALFAAFFPCLLAGPIHRARSFLPQLRELPRFDLVKRKSGLLRFLFGMFEKLVLADTLAIPVNLAFSEIDRSPLTWIVILLVFPLQIYFDFAAYSSMALGLAEALGFSLPENFRAPYASTSVRSFWKKWHISLTGWLREYLYFPLGGSRRGTLRTCCNILIVFAVSGLWHGAALHFVLWGVLNGLLQIWERLTQPLRKRLEQRLPGGAVRQIYRGACGVRTYLLMAATWLLFRVDSLGQLRRILGQLGGVFRTGFGELTPERLGLQPTQFWVIAAALAICVPINLRRAHGRNFHCLAQRLIPYYAAALLLALATAFFGVYGTGFAAQSFLYFRF